MLSCHAASDPDRQIYFRLYCMYMFDRPCYTRLTCELCLFGSCRLIDRRSNLLSKPTRQQVYLSLGSEILFTKPDRAGNETDGLLIRCRWSSDRSLNAEDPRSTFGVFELTMGQCGGSGEGHACAGTVWSTL